MIKPQSKLHPLDGRLQCRYQHPRAQEESSAHRLGRWLRCLCCDTLPCSVADGVEGLDVLRLGRGGSVAAMRCLLCRGRDVTHVSVNMWHTEGWSARNIKLAQEVAWYLRSLRDRLLASEVSSTCFQSISCRCLRLLRRSDTSKDGAEAMQHGRSTTTSWSNQGMVRLVREIKVLADAGTSPH